MLLLLFLGGGVGGLRRASTNGLFTLAQKPVLISPHVSFTVLNKLCPLAITHFSNNYYV